MAINSTLLAGLNASSLRTFMAVRIELISTGTSINLIDGSGIVTFPVDGSNVTFDGFDEVFGSLAGIGTIEEKIADEAPTLSITVMPRSEAAFGEFNQPENQGSSVRVWFGIVDDATGAAIGVPELMWSGRMDTVKSSVNANAQTCEIDTVSAFDRLFVQNEAECLNSVWHQKIWGTGETGLDYNVASTKEIYWGTKAPSPTTTPGGSSVGGKVSPVYSWKAANI